MTRIAIFQAHSGIHPAANAEALVSAVEEAAKGGAAMLFTPEMSGLLDRDRERAASQVQHQDQDVVLRAMRDAARKAEIWVHLGSLALESGDGRLVNRGFVIDAAGEIRGRYDKIHLFDVDLPTGERWRDRRPTRPATKPCWSGTPIGRWTDDLQTALPAMFAGRPNGADVIAVLRRSPSYRRPPGSDVARTSNRGGLLYSSRRAERGGRGGRQIPLRWGDHGEGCSHGGRKGSGLGDRLGADQRGAGGIRRSLTASRSAVEPM